MTKEVKQWWEYAEADVKTANTLTRQATIMQQAFGRNKLLKRG